jgi:hypothetical protein
MKMDIPTPCGIADGGELQESRRLALAAALLSHFPDMEVQIRNTRNTFYMKPTR